MGTNDTNNNEPIDAIKRIEESQGNMKNIFPEAEILISKLISRKKCIENINSFLAVYCKQNMPLIKYKIEESMLEGNKHLNREGFQMFYLEFFLKFMYTSERTIIGSIKILVSTKTMAGVTDCL